MNTPFTAAMIFATLTVLGSCAAYTASGAPAPAGLAAAAHDPNVVVYAKPDLASRHYDKVLIESTDISYDESSAYKGFTAAQQARIGEAAAAAIRAAIGERFTIVTEPGPGVLRIRAAITGVRAAETEKRFWSYTPFGFVKGRIDKATGKNVALLSATAEVELLDAQSGECLAAVADLNAGYESLSADEESATFRAVVAKLGVWTHRLVTQLASRPVPAI